MSLVIDANSNLYVGGYFDATVDFDPSAGTASATASGVGGDAFIAKYNSNGQYQWHTQITGSNFEQIWGIDLDNNNNIVITGIFNSPDADFDPVSSSNTLLVAPNTNNEIFVAKYDPSGNHLWSFSVGDLTHDDGKGIKCDATGNIYVTGYITGAPDFDPSAATTTLTGTGIYADAFIAKYDPAGNLIWCNNITSSPEDDVSFCIDLDASSNIYVGGYFKNVADFDPGAGTYTITGTNTEGFVAKYDANGALQWANALMGSPQTIVLDLDIQKNGELLITGNFNGGTLFDQQTSSGLVGTNGNLDIFFAKYNGVNGAYKWAYGVGGNNNDEGYTIESDMYGNIYAGGYVITGSVPAEFDVIMGIAGGYSVSAAQYYGNYLVKYNPVLKPNICLVTVDSIGVNNEIFWEKTNYMDADSFIVFRETSINNYRRIASIHKSAFSSYVDTSRIIGPFNGDPNTTSYKYKLQYRDTNQNYSGMSAWHQSIFIQDQQNGNFNWNAYAIETGTPPLTGYDLYRINIANGTYSLVTSTGALLASDPQYTPWQTTAKWRCIATGFNCNPTLKTTNAFSQKVKTRSNIKNDRLIGISEHDIISNAINVHPVPAKDVVTIEASVLDNMAFTLEVHNTLGQLVYSKKYSASYSNNLSVDVRELKSGVYFINFKEELKTIATKKIVVVK
jgi:hypothetical protein